MFAIDGGRCVYVLIGVLGNFLLLASIFSEQWKAGTLTESEDEGGGVGCLERRRKKTFGE